MMKTKKEEKKEKKKNRQMVERTSE